MPTIHEGQHRAEFLVSEANGHRSRKTVTIATGQDLQAGHVLGQITASSITASADGSNTGNGTIGGLDVLSGATGGDHRAVITEAATDGGTFDVHRPDGGFIGSGTVGSQFAQGGVQFTITDGSTDFAVGDSFTITLAGSGEYREYDPASTDGSDTARAILFDNIDTTGGAARATAVVRDAEVNAAELVWFDGAAVTEIAKATADLEAQSGILAR